MSLESPLSDEFLDDLLGAFDADALDGELNEPWALGPIADAQELNGVRLYRQPNQHCIAGQMRQSGGAPHGISVCPASIHSNVHSCHTHQTPNLFVGKDRAGYFFKDLKPFTLQGPAAFSFPEAGTGSGHWTSKMQNVVSSTHQRWGGEQPVSLGSILDAQQLHSSSDHQQQQQRHDEAGVQPIPPRSTGSDRSPLSTPEVRCVAVLTCASAWGIAYIPPCLRSAQLVQPELASLVPQATRHEILSCPPLSPLSNTSPPPPPTQYPWAAGCHGLAEPLHRTDVC